MTADSASTTPEIVLARARDTPDAELLFTSARAWNCRDFLQRAQSAATALRRLAGDSGQVAVSVRSSDDMPFVVVGSMLAGIELVLLPEFAEMPQLRAACSRLGCSVVLTDSRPAEGEVGLIPIEDAFSVTTAEAFPARSDGAFTFLTSGTEGSPKRVTLEHWKFHQVINAMQACGALAHASRSTVFLSQPLFHSYGLCVFLEYLHVGATIVLPAPASPLGPIASLIRSPLAPRIENIEGVPFFWQHFARTIDKLRLPRFRHVGLGGGKAEGADLATIVDRYPDVTVSLRYGLTETPSVATHKVYRPPHSGNWTSSGHALPCFTVQVRDAQGGVLQAGEEGEIFVLGPLVHGDSGVLATGDLGYLDAQGELFVTGRRSAFLKRRGYRLSPEVIESAALRSPLVQDCRASNVGEAILLEVVPRSEFHANSVLSHLRATLPPYAVPDEVRQTERIPRTPSGKVKRGRA